MNPYFYQYVEGHLREKISDEKSVEQINKFIKETPPNNEMGEWKFRLLGTSISRSLALDTLYIGGQSIADILKNHVTDKDIDPKIIEAYHLQFPQMGEHKQFVDEIRKFTHNPEGLRGFLGGIKGKLFEIDYRDYLNQLGHLPAGYHAELSVKENEKGVDIWIKDTQGHVHGEIQAKAMDSLKGVKEHLQRYPEIHTVVIPSDQIHQADLAGLGTDVVDGHETSSELTGTVGTNAEHASYYDHFHFPYIGFAFMAGEVAYLMYKGKPIPSGKLLKRGTKIIAAAGIGQAAFWLSHSFWVSLPAAIVTRIALDRYHETKDFLKDVYRMKEWSFGWRIKKII